MQENKNIRRAKPESQATTTTPVKSYRERQPYTAAVTARKPDAHDMTKYIDREVARRVGEEERKIKSGTFERLMRQKDQQLAQVERELREKKDKELRLRQIITNFKQLVDHMAEQKKLLQSQNSKLKALLKQEPDL